jgi:hypothetical protein
VSQVSQTITFSQASYVIDTDMAKSGTNALSVTNAIYREPGVTKASYLLQNYGNTTITGLSVEGQNSADTGLNMQVRGVNDATTPSVQSSQFNFGNANDFLVIGSSSSNTVNMGVGDDRLNVNYASVGDSLNVGLGSDTVVFGGNISKTRVDLGSDGAKDVVRLAQNATIKGLVITGADSSDMLYIGTTQYDYKSADNSWVNHSDANDKRQFS